MELNVKLPCRVVTDTEEENRKVQFIFCKARKVQV